MGKALFIGRFQPFHNGHLDALRSILMSFKSVVIIIGSANKVDSNNPWIVDDRIIMIQSIINQYTNIEIITLDDIEGDDEAWLQSLQQKVGDFDVIYSGNDWVLDICKKHTIPCKKISLRLPVSGTMIREKLSQKQDIKDFVPQVIYNYISEIPYEKSLFKRF